MKKCRVGLVGLGHVAQVCHLPGYKSVENIEVVAGAEIRGDVLKKVSSEFGFKGYSDYAAMFKKEKLDIVCALAGPKLAREITEKAAGFGINVLVEKPMALTLEDAGVMIEACRKAQVKLFYGETYRFMPTIRKAKEMIEAGLLGEVTLLLEVGVGGSGAEKFQLYQIYPDGAPGAGGSGLTDHGIHSVDIFAWLARSEVEWVFGRGTRAGQHPVTEFLTMKLKSGAIGQLVYNEATFPSDMPAEGIFSWGSYLAEGKPTWETNPVSYRIHGTKGALRLFPYANKLFYFSEGRKEEVRVEDKPHPQHFGRQIQSFANSILNGLEPEITGRDGVKALQIILAAYESSETQKIIPIKPLGAKE